MQQKGVIHAIEPIGDGEGRFCPDEIQPEDISVTVTQPFGTSDERGNRPTVSCWLSDESIRTHGRIQIPDPEADAPYDAVVILTGAPIPERMTQRDVDEIEVEISVEQARQAEASRCPDCDGDLRETFVDGGCTVCGFYFDGDHLDEERQAELDQLQAEYE